MICRGHLSFIKSKKGRWFFEWEEVCSWKEARELIHKATFKEAEEMQELRDKEIEEEARKISRVLGRRLERDPELVTRALGLVLDAQGYQVIEKTKLVS